MGYSIPVTINLFRKFKMPLRFVENSVKETLGGDIKSGLQFGMIFELEITDESMRNKNYAICQLIKPDMRAESVLKNKGGVWNVDNSRGSDILGPNKPLEGLYYKDSVGGVMRDTPTEILKKDASIDIPVETQFLAFIVDVENKKILPNGVTYGYTLEKVNGVPKLTISTPTPHTLTDKNDEFTVIENRCQEVVEHY